MVEDIEVVVPQPAAAVVVNAAIHGGVIVEAVVADRAVGARRVGVHAAAVLKLTSAGRLHRVADRIVRDRHPTHIPAPRHKYQCRHRKT